MRLLVVVACLSAHLALAQDPPDAGAPEAGAAPATRQAEAVAPEKAPAISVAVHGSLRLVGTGVSAFPLDADGTPLSPTPIETRVRLAPELAWRKFRLMSEFDLATGAVLGTPGPSLVAARVPFPSLRPAELRQLFLEYRWAWGGARLGLQTNHFGLGMLANAGARDAEPGDFGHQHFGSLALRALLLSRPFMPLGGGWVAVEPVAAFDLVVRDSTVDLLDGDRALQGILGVRLNVDEKNQLGLFAIYRSSRPLNSDTGERSTDVLVIDASAQWTFFDRLDLGAEVAGITGTTTQTRTPEHPLIQVRQLGAVAKASYRVGRFGFLLDWGLASGDADPYDGQLTNFRFDRDYKVGLVLFDQVLGWQSARSAWRASDPALVGYPPEGISLLPTGGAVTGAWYLFPRARVRVGGLVDVYGGPLFAFATAPLTDPFNTRVLAGGVPVNALNGNGSGMLGTELDVGAAIKHRFDFGLTLSAIAEGGVLLPGAALSQASGRPMGNVWLGRLRLQATY
ncbi:MAG: hypothetical protein INH41_14795 [Myxococcaceae bacterium]|jgi:hypothetical protein|nr:hypothetical protein [Myxococcaceae bacterium]MCA3013647.1 hypothetical protein [Myxococcaceae bacterium]